MSRKSSTETLVGAMRILARDIQSGDGVANAAITEAADRLAEQQARIAELEAQAAIGRRAVEMLRAFEWSAGGGGYCPSCSEHVPIISGRLGHKPDCRLGAFLRDAEQANNRVILDSSDHVPGATKMVTDRQLADAVNELRDIALKYHSAGQLRERIAGVVRGLVRGGQ